MKFDVYEYTSQGGREYNEDDLGSYCSDNGGIFVVADGLGGHSYGKEASTTVVDTLVSGWVIDAKDLPAQISDRVNEANIKILNMQKEKNCIMKTTVAILAINNNKAVMANVGDSRVYYFHNNELHSYTNDHSVAYKKFKSGEITREQIATDEDQASLLRAIGGEDRYLPEIMECNVDVVPGDAFMLCSDGAWEYLRDTEILIDLLKSKNAKQWSELLMLRIMERLNGGKNDNVSILTVMVY